MAWRKMLLGAAALMLIVPALATEGGAGRDDEDEYVRGEVEIKGTLRLGVFAIGGEHTGTEIEAEGVKLELDFRDRDDLRPMAERLDGEVVVATGRLEVRRGVERGPRWIVEVETLEAAGAD